MTEIDPVPAAPDSPRTSRRLVAVAAIVGALAVVGGAAFAWQKLAGGGPQPHDVLPASVIAYARVDGDPSASQKVSLFRLIRKAPDIAKEIGIESADQDIRKTLVESLLEDCEVDFDKEISPWLGNRFGFGLAESGDTGYFAIQVTDEKKARKGIALVAGCLGLKNPGLAFANGYFLLGEGKADTAAAAKEAAKSPLAEDPDFVEDMEGLGDPGIVSAWASAKALKDAFGAEFDAAGESLKEIRSGAAALRAGDDNIELAGVTHLNKKREKVSAVDLGRLPADSLFAASVSGGGKEIGSQWESFTEGLAEGFAFDAAPGEAPDAAPSEVDSMLQTIEDESGFSLPEDLETLFGDNITLVAGDRNLGKIDKFEGPEDVKRLDVAVALQSDQAKASALAEKIAAQVYKYLGIELAVVQTPKGAVIATNKKFAGSFTKGKGLRDNDTFNSVISDESSPFGGFYLDITKARKVAAAMDAPKKDLAQLKELRALGLSATDDGPRITRTTLRLSFR